MKMRTCDSVKDRQKTYFIFRSNWLSRFHSKAHGASINPDREIGKRGNRTYCIALVIFFSFFFFPQIQ